MALFVLLGIFIILLDESLFYMTYFYFTKHNRFLRVIFVILHDIFIILHGKFIILLDKLYFYLTKISLHITIVKRIIYMSESKSVING